MKEQILVKDFVNEFIEKKIVNTHYKQDAIQEFIKQRLEITEYLPFKTKRELVQMIVDSVIREEDGVKKVDSIAQFLSFITSMLISHTNLKIVSAEQDYDALNSCGLIEPIIAMFQKDYAECEALLKMSIADELAENNLSVVISKFLNGIGETVKGFTNNLDLSKLLGENIKEEDVAKILGFIDKIK